MKDGKTLVVLDRHGLNQTVTIWDVASGDELLTLNPDGAQVTAFACSPDGRTIVTANNSQTLTFWDPVIGQERYNVATNLAEITCLSFSRDSRLLAASDTKGMVKVWHALGPSSARP